MQPRDRAERRSAARCIGWVGSAAGGRLNCVRRALLFHIEEDVIFSTRLTGGFPGRIRPRKEGVKAKAGDIRRLFHRVGDTTATRMRFELEMVVPRQATDDFGQTATATTTFLSYTLELGLRGGADAVGGNQLEVLQEELTYLPRNTANRRLLFPHAPATWRKRVIDRPDIQPCLPNLNPE